MSEQIELWWARRQRSKGTDVPYPIGTYRAQWQQFPVLVRQYHPDLNHGITLTQIPPAADVFLVWECDAGHRFVATPTEQRSRPGRMRRASSWCPECLTAALGRSVPRMTATRSGSKAASKTSRQGSHRRRSGLPTTTDVRTREAADVPVGDAFVSRLAPAAASAAEPELRRRLAARLDTDMTANSVRVSRPFHGRLEVWPDIVLSDLRVAIEYDTTGRHGLEHVGRREESDRRKDRLLRAAGWEVIRVRCGALTPIGPYDVGASGVTNVLVGQIIEQLCAIRGDLFVHAYARVSHR
jgi:hypothetical protein